MSEKIGFWFHFFGCVVKEPDFFFRHLDDFFHLSTVLKLVIWVFPRAPSLNKEITLQL